MKLSMAALWAGVALAPLGWFVSFEANFALAPLACTGYTKGFLYAVSGLAFALSILGGALSWNQHTLLRENSGLPVETRTSKRAMAAAGVGISLLFALVILAQAIPNLMLAGCE